MNLIKKLWYIVFIIPVSTSLFLLFWFFNMLAWIFYKPFVEVSYDNGGLVAGKILAAIIITVIGAAIAFNDRLD